MLRRHLLQSEHLILKVGDLVKFKKNGQHGIVIGKEQRHFGWLDRNGICRVLWTDGSESNRWHGELELVNASR